MTTRILITIRHRGRSRRYRRMLRTLPDYGGKKISAENGRRTIIEAEFPTFENAFHFALVEREAAISITEI